MKKIFLLVLFIFGIVGYADHGIWKFVNENRGTASKMEVIFIGDPDLDISQTDEDNPSGYLYSYENSAVLTESGDELELAKAKYRKNELEPGKAKVTNLGSKYKNWQTLAVVRKTEEDNPFIILFNQDAYKDIKIYNKGNKTIIKYLNLYILFDKDDYSFENATAWG